jgi:hypothetical protein
MIQLKDLDLEMTEVIDGELGSIVGGDSGLTPIGYSDLTFKAQGVLGGASQYSAAWQNGYGWGAAINTSGTGSFTAPLGNSSSVDLQYNANTNAYQGTVKWRVGESPAVQTVNKIDIFADPFSR